MKKEWRQELRRFASFMLFFMIYGFSLVAIGLTFRFHEYLASLVAIAILAVSILLWFRFVARKTSEQLSHGKWRVTRPNRCKLGVVLHVVAVLALLAASLPAIFFSGDDWSILFPIVLMVAFAGLALIESSLGLAED